MCVYLSLNHTTSAQRIELHVTLHQSKYYAFTRYVHTHEFIYLPKRYHTVLYKQLLDLNHCILHDFCLDLRGEQYIVATVTMYTQTYSWSIIINVLPANTIYLDFVKNSFFSGWIRVEVEATAQISDVKIWVENTWKVKLAWCRGQVGEGPWTSSKAFRIKCKKEPLRPNFTI